MAKDRAGINFGGLAKICFIVALVMGIWIMVPAAKCSVSGMDDTDLQTEEELSDLEDSVEERSSDVTRVSSSGNFLSRFFGNIGTCYKAYPLGTADVWKQYTLYGAAGGFVLFLILGSITKPRSNA